MRQITDSERSQIIAAACRKWLDGLGTFASIRAMIGMRLTTLGRMIGGRPFTMYEVEIMKSFFEITRGDDE